MQENLWAKSRRHRLAAARSLSVEDVSAIQEELCRDCPVGPWPYGSPTTINPIVATLGASPGDSPAPGDTGYVTRGAQPMPPAGSPHPGVFYKDPRKYWDKVRLLAKTILMGGGLEEEDALSLFANLNLDTGASGDSENVIVDLGFARWLLLNVRDNLRPQFLIFLGLSTYLKNNPKVVRLFEATFTGFRYAKPRTEFAFDGYSAKKYRFREWDVTGPLGNDIKIVMWPQHPSRAPMTNFDVWRASCREFKDRHSGIIV